MVIYFPNVDPLYLYKRQGTTEDPFIPLQQDLTVKYTRVTLKEIPDFTTKVTVTDPNNITLTEVTTDTLQEQQYRVDYSTGNVFFHASVENIKMHFSYLGTGYVNIGANRLIVDTSDTNAEALTFQNILDEQGNINNRLNDVNSNIDTLTQALNSKLSVQDAANTYATQSQITQLANDINLRVKENDVINQINISTEGILIDGKKVHITGQTTIDNAVITSAMIQSVDATKINATSLSAISANLGNVTAGNITGVTMNLANGKFVVDSNGNVTFKGALSGATGSFSGDLSTGHLTIGQSSPSMPWYEDATLAVEFKNPVRVTDGVYQWGDSFFIKVGNNEVHLNGLNVIVDDTLIANSLSATTINGTPIFSGNIHTQGNVIKMDYSSGNCYFTSNGTSIFKSDASGAGDGISVGVDSTGARIWSMDIYNRTYSSGTNVCITSSGTLGRVTSALKYKTDIEAVDLSNEYAERILSLVPKSWHDKAELARYNRGETNQLNRYYGLIAEDVEQAGLNEYVTYAYDENGNKETEGLQYDRLWTLLIPIVKDHNDQMSTLLEQNQNLILKVADLEMQIADIKQKMEAA